MPRGGAVTASIALLEIGALGLFVTMGALPELVPVFALAVLLGIAAFGGAYLVSRQMCHPSAAAGADDLEWLRVEFKLGPAEMTQIRKLHEGYLPECAEMCRRIAEKQRELDAVLNGNPSTGPLPDATRAKLVELGLLRAQCQSQMLEHFAEVSRAMPPEQGRRYLTEMQRLTLGSHEQIEQSMSNHEGHAHGHN